ncbi:hypothetical protein M405DRAFT_829216, partial [Rhizopogon salebrosus TDB-379]
WQCSGRRLFSPHHTVLALRPSRLEPAVFGFSFPHPPLPYPSLFLGFSQPTIHFSYQFYEVLSYHYIVTFMLQWSG